MGSAHTAPCSQRTPPARSRWRSGLRLRRSPWHSRSSGRTQEQNRCREYLSVQQWASAVRRSSTQVITPTTGQVRGHQGSHQTFSVSPCRGCCSTATKSASGCLTPTAPCAGMLGTAPHQSQPPCCPYHSRNRKPFRAGGRVRPASGRGGDNTGKTHLNRHRSR
eukprot:COSAG02_NODE_6622_length_3453_cov_7.921586_3_plen_164_part_00